MRRETNGIRTQNALARDRPGRSGLADELALTATRRPGELLGGAKRVGEAFLERSTARSDQLLELGELRVLFGEVGVGGQVGGGRFEGLGR